MHGQVSLRRPRTAPSAGTAIMATPMPPPPRLPLAMERLSARHEMKAPSRPPRPDSGVIRDVNAWLDASKPASPLMGGLPYWRDGAQGAHTGETLDVQYAIPIVREPEGEQPSTPGSQQLRSFCRRAKRMQARMPSLRRTRSQRAIVQKINRRSNSTPLMGIPYEETQEGSPPSLLTRFGSARRPTTATAATQTAQGSGWFRVGQSSLVELPLRRGRPANLRSGGPESNVERPVPVVADIPREESMGSISDAPTYFSGLPPPPYRSRAASVLTTSSFGCIDGMNPEQRQLSQQRAQQKQGVKGKLKRFAQRCTLAN